MDSRYYRAYGEVQSMEEYDEETEQTTVFYYLGNYRSAVSSKGVTQYEQFQLNVKQTANYDLSFRASTKTNVGTLRFVITDDATMEQNPEAAPEYDQTFNVEVTGKWTTFQPYTYHDVQLTEGMKMLTIYFDTTAADGDPDYKYTCNLGAIRFSIPGEDTAVKSIDSDEQLDLTKCYNLNGQRLAAPQKGINIVGNKKVVFSR